MIHSSKVKMINKGQVFIQHDHVPVLTGMTGKVLEITAKLYNLNQKENQPNHQLLCRERLK